MGLTTYEPHPTHNLHRNPNSSCSAVRPSQKIRMMTSLKRKELPGSTPTRFVLRSPQSPHNGGKWIFMRNLKGFTTTHRKNSLSTVETDVEKEFFRRELCGVLNFISIWDAMLLKSMIFRNINEYMYHTSVLPCLTETFGQAGLGEQDKD